MLTSLSCHNMIMKYNLLQSPTKKISDYFDNHPRLFKMVLLTTHVFRAVTMSGFCSVVPFSLPVSMVLGFAGSLIYRLTIETNCAYKFALPAFAGSLTYLLAKSALDPLVSRKAHETIRAFGLIFSSAFALAAYTTYIVLTVDYDVDEKLCKKRCLV